ncbi:MAG: rhomboid family intramembrane serine protease [Synechococcaceae cyanobacterium]|nr:rhomboid family intramembrane serine protease [Synechococcaceae cyanobacterium]
MNAPDAAAASLWRSLRARLLLPPLLLLIPWSQELIDQLLFGGRWNLPMLRGESFLGVLSAPFSHSGFTHLVSNTLWFLPLSWLVLLRGSRDYLAVWLGVYVAAIPVWLLWPVGSHGLSGVIYGLLGYLLSIGWLERRAGSILLSLLALWIYGGLLPNLLPLASPPGVSWIGHVSGFAGGLLAARAMHRRPRLLP